MKQLLAAVCVFALVYLTTAAVDQNCLNCICKVESNCKPLDCKMDVGSLSCGYYQIKKPYYIDCGEPGKRSGEGTDAAWKRCAKDKTCADQCVQNYMRRYAARCKANPTCETYARVHNGGPNGCKNSNTLGYWGKVQKCL